MANVQYFTEKEVEDFQSPKIPSDSRFKNMLGMVVDELVVVKYYGKKKNHHDQSWFCKCTCGRFVLKNRASILNTKNRKMCFQCTRDAAAKSRLGLTISKIKETHGDTYTYDFSDYVNTKSKITITCKEHGAFTQCAQEHYSGQGCPECGRLKANMNHRNDYGTFLSRSEKAHGSRYLYDKVEYITRRTVVTITCKEHGDFLQMPADHWRGQGCPICRYITSGGKIRHDTAHFIAKAQSVHGDHYDYSKSEYTGSTNPLTIICPDHGEFEQSPTVHYGGFGCSGCATHGYNTEGGGYFYITSLSNTLLKYGITSKEPAKRMTQHKLGSSYTHTLLHYFFFEDGYIPKRIEKYVRDNIGKKATTKELLPDGYTETCCISKLGDILEVVTRVTEESNNVI